MNNNSETKKLYHDAIELLGRQTQIIKTFEETAEFQNALAKFELGRASTDDVASEIVDVMIMLEQVMILLDIDNETISRIRTDKLDRLKGIVSKAITIND